MKFKVGDVVHQIGLTPSQNTNNGWPFTITGLTPTSYLGRYGPDAIIPNQEGELSFNMEQYWELVTSASGKFPTIGVVTGLVLVGLLVVVLRKR